MKHTLFHHIIICMLSACPSYFTAYASHDVGSARYPLLRYNSAPRAEWRGDSLSLGFSGEVTGRLRGALSLHVIPLYISGNDTIRFPELGYLTPSEATFDKRRKALSGNRPTGTVRVLRRGDRGYVEYRKSVLVPSSMKGEIKVLQVLRDCCDSYPLTSEAVAVPRRGAARPDSVHAIGPGMLPLPAAAVSLPLFEANMTFVRPEVEPIKRRTATATIRITYPRNHWKVYPDFESNGEELRRVDRLLAPVTSDTATYRILSASITGYASPEDTWGHNLTLSEKRAGGMRDYLRERYSLPARKIAVRGAGEDWDGLREAVERSDMPEKRRILAIIDNYDIFAGREKILMDLQGGEPYKYMMRHLFPPLRRMEMRIDYLVRPFAREEAGELIGSRPQDLSLREMYEVAQAGNNDRNIIKSRDGYGREYYLAVRYFPDSDIAIINASSAALMRGDLELAWQCLGKVRDNPLAYNNLGVYHWICGRIDEAKAYFEKAMETDPGRAAYNLEQLREWEDNFNGKDSGE